jgi:hypothetical protein
LLFGYCHEQSSSVRCDIQVLEPQAMIDFVTEEHPTVKEEAGNGGETGLARSPGVFAELGGIFTTLKSVSNVGDALDLPSCTECLALLFDISLCVNCTYAHVSNSREANQYEGCLANICTRGWTNV